MDVAVLRHTFVGLYATWLVVREGLKRIIDRLFLLPQIQHIGPANTLHLGEHDFLFDKVLFDLFWSVVR